MTDADEIAQSPDGRPVRLAQSTWEHVLARHPPMIDYLTEVIETIEQPELVQVDPRPGRVRHFRRSGPERWMRVVVEFGSELDSVVTAFPQRNDPPGWRT